MEKIWTEGVILKMENQGEADQFLTVFTKDFGKFEILAKSIRKIASKLRSGIELFYLSKLCFVQGKSFKILTDVILLEKFKNLRDDLKKLDIVYKILETTDSLIKDEEKDEVIWQLLIETLERLNKLQITSYKLQYHYFLWHFFSLLGYKPELYFCFNCQKKLRPGKLRFSLIDGGIICEDCFKKNQNTYKNAMEIDINTVKILRIILEKKLNILEKVKKGIDEKNLEEISQISLNMLK